MGNLNGVTSRLNHEILDLLLENYLSNKITLDNLIKYYCDVKLPYEKLGYIE